MALFTKDTPAAPVKVPARTDPQGIPTLTYFGPNVTVDGTVTGSEPVLIEGTVRGKIELTGDLRIGTHARVEATVHAKSVTVEGKLNGDVSADDRVELVTTAVVDGNLKAPKIVVAEGATFRGSVDMGSTTPRDGHPTQPTKK
jgi:cytoskeletal protein CcmA (bactofilin family)